MANPEGACFEAQGLDKQLEIINTSILSISGGGGGDASAANQVIGNASLSSIDGKTPALVSGRQPVDGSGVTQPISAAALPLPSGASTETTLSALNTKVTAVNTGAVVVSSSALPSGAATAAKQPAIGTAGTPSADILTVQGAASMTALKVDASATTQPISGTVTANAGTGTFAVSAAALPLPSGAATSALQTTINTTLGTPMQQTGGTVTANAGTNLNTSALVLDATVTGGTQRTKITDGTNNAAVKAASTAAVAADPAVVVAISPNNTLSVAPATSDITGQGTQTASGQNIILATAGTTATDAAGYNSFSIEITPTGTVSSGVVTFEASNDNTTFQAIPLYDVNSLTANPVTTVSPTTGVIRHMVGALPFRYVRARISTVIGGGGSIAAVTHFMPNPWVNPQQTVTQATAANLNCTATIASGTVTTVSTLSNTTQLTPGVAATNLGKAEDAAAASGDTGVAVWGVRRDVATISASAVGDYNEMAVGQFGDTYTSKLGTRKRSYSTAFQIVPAASATDVVEIIGSASTTVEIVRITIGGVQTTAGQVLTNILRRSTAATSGTSTNQTLVPHQATDAAATAVIKAYTANPTTGTLVGNVRSRRLPIGQSVSLADATVFEFGENAKPIFLAGVAQTFCINLGGATVTGGTLDVEVEFTEF